MTPRLDFLYRFIIIFLALTIGSRLCHSATLEEKLGACDAALTARNQQISMQDLGVKYRDDELERRAKEISTLRNKENNILSNPFVWAAIGVIAGTYIGSKATR